MGQPHKHRDVIIAWANGEEIEFKTTDECLWRPVDWANPVWFEGYEYRVKPKIVKREGWMNVYLGVDTGKWYVYPTKKEADEAAGDANTNRRCIRIEWEEEA